MMQTLKAIALASASAMCIAACICLVSLRQTLRETTATTAAIHGMVDDAHRKGNIALDDAHHLLLETGLTAKEARLAAKEQRIYWNQISARTVTTFDRADVLIAGLSRTNAQASADSKRIADAAVEALGSVPPAMASLKTPMSSANTALLVAARTMSDADVAVQHMDAVISDPSIQSTLKHADGTMANVEKVSAKFAAPSSVAKAVWTGVLDVSYKLASFFK